MRAKSRSYFTISVQTKPFLKKYLHSKYGDPLIFTTDNLFGMVIAGLLEKPIHIHKKKDILRLRTDRYDDVLIIHCPIMFLTKYRLGCDLNDSQKITLNKLFEEKFEEELTYFCTLLNICGVDTKDAVEEFCKNYNIEVGTGCDITYDALRKKEYRYRKKLIKNTPQVSPQNMRVIQQTMTFGKNT